MNLSEYPTYSIAIPSLEENPFIWRSNYPEGFIFIVVGAVATALFVSMITWHVVASALSERRAKENLYNNHNKNRYVYEKDSSSSENSIFFDEDYIPDSTRGGDGGIPDNVALVELPLADISEHDITPRTTLPHPKRKATPSMYLDKLIYGSEYGDSL